MKKTTTVTEKLKGYSLLAGSILASSLAANAQVIYKDVEPDIELGGTVPGSLPATYTQDLDLNNDGTVDFNLDVNLYGATGSGYSFLEVMKGGTNFLNAIMTYTINYAPFNLKLDLCDSVPPNNYVYGAHTGNFAFKFGVSGGYIWQNVIDKFVGVRFRIGSESHFGWVRLDVNTTAPYPGIIIKSYAYEATANKHISTCDTGFGVIVVDPQVDNQLTLFPNPSYGECTIRLPRPLTEEAELTVTDVTGRKIFSANIPAAVSKEELQFNFEQFAAGTYLVQLQSSSMLLTQKWVKR